MLTVFLIWWGSMTDKLDPTRVLWDCCDDLFSLPVIWDPKISARLASSHFSSHLCWLEPQWNADVEILPRVVTIVIKRVVCVCMVAFETCIFFHIYIYMFFFPIAIQVKGRCLGDWCQGVAMLLLIATPSLLSWSSASLCGKEAESHCSESSWTLKNMAAISDDGN